MSCTYQIYGLLGPNPLDLVHIVAAQEDAEVRKLLKIHVKALQDLGQVKLSLLSFLTLLSLLTLL